MDEKLPDEFDIIVVGTGLSESILSGALSRIGKKVLHLDQNKYYGSSWSSFNLRAFESWVQENDVDTRSAVHNISDEIDCETEELVIVENIRKTTEQGVATCYLPDALEEPVVPSENVTVNPELEEKNQQDVIEDEKMMSSEVVKEESSEERSSSDTNNERICEASKQADCEYKELMEVDAAKEQTESEKSAAAEESDVEKVGENYGIIKNLAKGDKPKAEVDKNTKEYFYSKWRHYNLDLAPKLMFSRGKLVELLITSNVCRYLEFRNVTRTLTLLDDGSNTPQKLAPVPCSRTDVFTSKFVTMIEKRMLMRVLTMCANYENHSEEYAEFEDKNFVEFLAAKKLSKKLQHFILHSISMVDENASTMDGLKATQKFLKSLGRYGNSAFLWPLYGVGELPQAFCRLGAVFGGTFCLCRSVHAFIINKENKQCVGIIDSTGQRLKCQQLILDECYVPDSHRVKFANTVSRAIYITDSSLLPSDKENVSLITIPPTSELPSSRLIEVGQTSCVCPSNYYVVHALTSIQSSEVLPSPQSKFENMEKILFQDITPIQKGVDLQMDKKEGESNEDSEMPQTSGAESAHQELKKPRVLWSTYFNMMSGGVDTESLPSNVYVTRGPSMDLGFDQTVSEAQRLFELICPDEEFLPRAPNPDEIIYFDQDDEGYNTETNGTHNEQSQEIEGEYQEDESEVDVGSGEPPDQVDSVDEEQVSPDSTQPSAVPLGTS